MKEKDIKRNVLNVKNMTTILLEESILFNIIIKLQKKLTNQNV